MATPGHSHGVVQLYVYGTRNSHQPKRLDKYVYLLPFGSNGERLPGADRQLDNVASWISKHGVTDIVLMSHGWNHTPADARKLYRDFFSAYEAVRPTEDERKLLYIGVYWPSILCAETWGTFRARDLTPQDMAVNPLYDASNPRPTPDSESVVDEFAHEESEMKPALKLAFQESGCDQDQALARVLQPFIGKVKPDEMDLETNEAPTSVVASAQDLQDLAASGKNDAVVRGIVTNNVVNLAAVRYMKKRAGRIGGSGVKNFLTDVLVHTEAHIHLIGHSFGCKLLLEAVRTATADAKPALRQVESLVLIQPAVSRWALSPRLPGGVANVMWRTTTPGLYAGVPSQVRRPVLVLFSNRDYVLRYSYPLAFGIRTQEGPVARDGDRDAAVGDKISMQEVAGASLLAAALGAHGPDIKDGVSERQPVLSGGTLYRQNDQDDRTGPRIVGIKGAWSHSASNLEENGWCRESAAWAVYQAQRGRV